MGYGNETRFVSSSMDEGSDEDAVYGDEVAQVIPIEDADGLHDQEEGTYTAWERG